MKRNASHVQVAALPIRKQTGRADVLLVKTRSGRWAPPKGWPVEGLPLHGRGANSRRQTNVPMLYAAGDVLEGQNQIACACGQVAIAATAIHNKLRRSNDRA